MCYWNSDPSHGNKQKAGKIHHWKTGRGMRGASPGSLPDCRHPANQAVVPSREQRGAANSHKRPQSADFRR